MTDETRRLLGSEAVKKVVAEQHRIQAAVDRTDESDPGEDAGKPMQAGQREYPASFPEQHLRKPGMEPI